MPALCPRIRLRLTDAPMDEAQRIAGEGTLDQIRADLPALQSLGADYVLLDTYTDDPKPPATTRPCGACSPSSPSTSSTSAPRVCVDNPSSHRGEGQGWSGRQARS